MNDGEDEIDRPTLQHDRSPEQAAAVAREKAWRSGARSLPRMIDAPLNAIAAVSMELQQGSDARDDDWHRWQRRQLPQIEALLVGGILCLFVAQWFTTAAVILLAVVTVAT